MRNNKSHKKLIIILFSVAIAMFAFGFALVPLYDVMCSALGLNGKTGGATAASVAPIDKTRTVTVQFLATNNDQLKWKFYPNTRKVELHPGQNQRISYYAENDTKHTMTVQAVPSVTPGVAARYLKKTECFCFNQQTLASKAHIDMPILFHLDRDIPKNIHEVTLSYTLFAVKKTSNVKRVKRPGRIR